MTAPGEYLAGRGAPHWRRTPPEPARAVAAGRRPRRQRRHPVHCRTCDRRRCRRRHRRNDVLVAGVAAIVAGACSMAVGEYVSVSSQRDAEQADLAIEAAALRRAPARRTARAHEHLRRTRRRARPRAPRRGTVDGRGCGRRARARRARHHRARDRAPRAGSLDLGPGVHRGRDLAGARGVHTDVPSASARSRPSPSSHLRCSARSAPRSAAHLAAAARCARSSCRRRRSCSVTPSGRRSASRCTWNSVDAAHLLAVPLPVPHVLLGRVRDHVAVAPRRACILAGTPSAIAPLGTSMPPGTERAGADERARRGRRRGAARSTRADERAVFDVQPSRCARWPIVQSSPTIVSSSRVQWMHRAVLHRRTRADHDAALVAAQHGLWPDRRAAARSRRCR